MSNITFSQEGSPIATFDGVASQYNPGDIAYMLLCSALVMIMSPAIGLLYSGLLRRKSALSQMFLALAGFGVVSVQWALFGYSLAFSHGNPFIGGLRNGGMVGVDAQPSELNPRMPALLVALYQLMFATITPLIAIGATAERGRLAPALVWIFLWSTFVYDPIAHWSFHPAGWAASWGVLDFAGGGVVHMSSGAAALAYCVWLGRRTGYGTAALAYRPSNVMTMALGTVLLWFGWTVGFNGGSALSANLRAVQASFVTNLSASAAGLSFMALDMRIEGKLSAVSACTGIVAGLVAITPASGFVGIPAALCIGFTSGIVCNFATRIKVWLGIDDCLDIVAAHLVGGAWGNLLTGVFAQKSIAAFDGTTIIDGGWLDGNWVQVPKQLAYSGAVLGYSFVVSSIILLLLDLVPGLTLRVTINAEAAGVDATQMNEFAIDMTPDKQELEIYPVTPQPPPLIFRPGRDHDPPQSAGPLDDSMPSAPAYTPSREIGGARSPERRAREKNRQNWLSTEVTTTSKEFRGYDGL